MEVEMEFLVAAEMWLKARQPKSVDIYGTRRSCLVDGSLGLWPVK